MVLNIYEHIVSLGRFLKMGRMAEWEKSSNCVEEVDLLLWW